MNKRFFIRSICCIGFLTGTLYFYLDRQNRLTQAQIALPHLAKEVKILKEENIRLQYQIEQFESPVNLLNLAKKSEFSHLRHPMSHQVMMVSEGIALQLKPEDATPPAIQIRPRITFARVAK